MKYFAKSLLLLTMLLSAVSCDEGNLKPEESDKPDSKVPVTISSASVHELTSKAGIPAGRLTSGSLGLFFKTEGDELEAYNAANREVNYSNDAWSIQGSTLYWKNAETKVSYYAYYPYSSSVTANESLSFDVPATQNADNIKSADLLYSPVATTTKNTDESIKLSFKHALSKLKINITISNELGSDYTINSVSLNNCNLSGEINLNTGVVSTKGASSSAISLFKESDSSYEGILVPQSTAYSLEISITIAGDEELIFEYTAPSSHSFVSGYQYNLPVQLSIESKKTKTLVSDAVVSEWTTTNLDPIVGKVKCDDDDSNEGGYYITYTTTDGKPLADFYSGYLIDHKYENGEGRLIFDKWNSSLGGFSGYENLKSITMPDYYVESIKEMAFSNCVNLTDITFGKGIRYIEDSAFSSCNSLTNIILPDEVISIGDHAFSSCSNLTSVTIPNDVDYIGKWAFGYCRSLTNITLPGTITSIMEYSFDGCNSLTGVTIPDSVESIEKFAFRDCGLTSITIGKGVKNIKEGAFGNCISLIDIYCKPINPPSIWSLAFYKVEGSSYEKLNITNLYIPRASVDAYKATGWNWVASNIIGYDFE